MKHVLILDATPRVGGNSEVLAESFAKGAKEAGNAVEIVKLREKKIGYCHGCYYCAEHEGHCCQKDDAEAIVDEMIKADVIVFATPTYFYSMAGQLKVMIDRTVMKYLEIKGKEVYYIISAWDSDKKNLEKVVAAIQGFTTDCLPDCHEKGILIGAGLEKVGEAAKSPYLGEAYRLGKAC
jgi:multimeric flavodoxin WrbA